jgi:hypothetical protein
MATRKDRMPQEDRMADILVYLRLNASDDAARTTLAIAAHFGMKRENALKLCHQLADRKKIYGRISSGRSRTVIWRLGKSIIPAPAKESATSGAVPTRRTVTSWEPHLARDPLTAALFGDTKRCEILIEPISSNN